MTNLDSILKSRDITLPTKIHLAKAMVFLVVMYGHESWTVKKSECQRMLKLPHNCTHLTDQPWDFFGRNDAKAETPVLWPPHVKS